MILRRNSMDKTWIAVEIKKPDNLTDEEEIEYFTNLMQLIVRLVAVSSYRKNSMIKLLSNPVTGNWEFIDNGKI